MRIRFSLVSATGFLLALPVLASAVSPSVPVHKRHAHDAHATSSQCGHVAGHASHTVLANPAAVPCHALAGSVASVQTTADPGTPADATAVQPLPDPVNPTPVTHVRAPAAALTTKSATTHASIPRVARIHFVPPLRGSLESLMRQNERDQAEGLIRIEDDAQLDQLEFSRDIVPVPASYSLHVNPALPANRRYCRPWTARFLADLAHNHYARFHRSLQVNSAVRTVEYQRSLIAINGNAAPADGDIASPHLTGAAVDIGKKGMSFSELAWMRAWLLLLQTAGKIDVEEEFYQSCFHITVYRSYTPPAPPRTIAHRHHATTTLLAAGVH
ncbi:MAG: DUF5715 family protein [Acidobacteriaceae bacterium]